MCDWDFMTVVVVVESGSEGSVGEVSGGGDDGCGGESKGAAGYVAIHRDEREGGEDGWV